MQRLVASSISVYVKKHFRNSGRDTQTNQIARRGVRVLSETNDLSLRPHKLSRLSNDTIEHLNCDGPFYWSDGLQPEDIVICCGSCNSSRGAKKLTEWFTTRYCIEKNINAKTVAAPVRTYLRRADEVKKLTKQN